MVEALEREMGRRSKLDNFIDCGFSLKEIGINGMTSWRFRHKSKWRKLYKISIEQQDDIFKEEDEIFIEEEGENCYTVKELAEINGVSIRTMFRRKAKELQNER